MTRFFGLKTNNTLKQYKSYVERMHGLIKRERFQAILLKHAFNLAIVSKLAMRPPSLTLTKTATLTNIFVFGGNTSLFSKI